MPASDDTPFWPDHDRHGGDFFPPPSTPRAVKGGIRLQGPGATSWWSRRWLAVFEAIGAGERLERGRAYAKGGQVRTLDIGLGEARAAVQGTRRTPYDTRIALRTIDQAAWLRIADALAARASYRSALHAGTIPEDIEAVFARAGVQLFPSLEDDVELTCTCDDWARPCRHAAAVSFLLGEALDRDPFLVFRLRGLDRDVLLALVDGRTPGADATDTDAAPEQQIDTPAIDADQFWNGAADDRPAPVDLQPPAIDAPLVRILGAPPQWRGERPFERAMASILSRAARDARVIDLALGAPRTADDR